MARGWDSKSVEEQQASAEAAKVNRLKPSLSAEERQRQTVRDGLLLTRTKIVNDLAAASDQRHRDMLEQALAHIDHQLDS